LVHTTSLRTKTSIRTKVWSTRGTKGTILGWKETQNDKLKNEIAAYILSQGNFQPDKLQLNYLHTYTDQLLSKFPHQQSNTDKTFT
jgi:hypothetical protein